VNERERLSFSPAKRRKKRGRASIFFRLDGERGKKRKSFNLEAEMAPSHLARWLYQKKKKKVSCSPRRLGEAPTSKRRKGKVLTALLEKKGNPF